jgi:hypothetical protein
VAHGTIVKFYGLEMKVRNLDVVIKFTLICFVLGSFYFLYNYNDHNGMGKVQYPLPTTYQLDVLFKIIAEHSGDQEAIVNIMEDGKYSLPGENFTFDYQVDPTSFEALNRVKSVSERTPNRNKKSQWEGYLRVHLFGEELSKQMLVFMGVGNSPGFEKMKIVAPRFVNGESRSTGPTSFDDVYNLDELNQVYAENGYPPVVLDKEYDDVCKDVKPIYVVAFIPPRSTPKYIGYTDNIRDQLYGKDIKPGKKYPERWIDCDFNKKALRPLSVNLTERKMICTTYRFNISTLRQTVLKNAKCIEVPIWSDHGMYKRPSRPDTLSPLEIFLYLLNPSDMLVNEVNAFTDQFLERPYVAIHIRANHINVLPTTTNRCFNVAMRVVEALKEKRGVKSVYISTDMNKYGGLGSYDPGHEEYFAAISGAIRYKPNATGQLGDISRSSISITNVLLLRRSDHLIAIGTGSFHGFVMGQFLREHFGKDPKMWSMIRMCENARGGGMTRDPNADYSKYIED